MLQQSDLSSHCGVCLFAYGQIVITARIPKSCWKVMFSQVSVRSQGGGCPCPRFFVWSQVLSVGGPWSQVLSGGTPVQDGGTQPPGGVPPCLGLGYPPTGTGVPPHTPETVQKSEYLLCLEQYASWSHAGGLPCLMQKINTRWT